MSADLNRGPNIDNVGLDLGDLVPLNDLPKEVIEKRKELREEIKAELAKHMDYENL